MAKGEQGEKLQFISMNSKLECGDRPTGEERARFYKFAPHPPAVHALALRAGAVDAPPR